MTEIILAGGQIALIDDEDYQVVSKYKWHLCKKGRNRNYGYAETVTYTDKDKKHISMHRLIMNAQPGQIIDHANRNTLDNRKCNLRFADYTQNQCNSMRYSPNLTSGFKGVYLKKDENKWYSQITYRKRHYFIGYFSDEAVAAFAYDLKAIELHGEFAKTNYPRSVIEFVYEKLNCDKALGGNGENV